MLFKTISEIKTFLPIGAGNDFNRLKPHISAAENKYIKPLLGTSMYDELQEFYDADYPENPSEVQQATLALQEKVQLARERVLHEAEEARQTASTAAWWTFGSALASAAAAVVGGILAVQYLQ